MSLKSVVGGFVDEGSRVVWTALEAAAGFLAVYIVPDNVFDFAGAYEPAVVGAAGVAVATVAAKLKEAVRKHRDAPASKA